MAAKRDPIATLALLRETGLTPDALERAQVLARQWGVPVHKAILSLGLVSEADYGRALARASGLHWTDWDFKLTPVGAVGQIAGQPIYRAVFPSGEVAAIVPAGADTPDAVHRVAHDLQASGIPVCLATDIAVRNALEQATRRSRLNRAIHLLARRHPDLSAVRRLTTWQACALGTTVGLFGGAAWFAPATAIAGLMTLLTVAFTGVVLVRLVALVELIRRRADHEPQQRPLPDHDLPTYSVLVPIFEEASVLPGLIAALGQLDYPQAKLEILLVFEESDLATKAALLTLATPPTLRSVVVPDSQPQTKPKALNYAMHMAHGDMIVVFDAEDRPEPDQLRKAAAAFRDGPSDLACVQARLNIYNPRDSWFSRQFTVEYSALFDAILPALGRMGLPIPLGGTSNHFRRHVLTQVGGWDPYNVTEDADLGVRLARLGWRVAMLNSTTWEEAPISLGQWWKQRTRWLKGWMQTYLVHTRQPWRLWQDLGVRPTIGFHAYLGGLILSALVQPIFYALILARLLSDDVVEMPALLGGEGMWWLAVGNLVVGYAAAILVGVISVRQRHHRLTLSAMLLPACWLLISLAAYRALWQLWRDPFRWEKTQHGRTRGSST